MTSEEQPIDGNELARMAGLEPGEGPETESIATQVQSLLDQFSVLRSIDTHGVAPMTAPQVPELRLRDDQPAPPMDPAEVLRNAAKTRDGAFLVETEASPQAPSPPPQRPEEP